MNLVSWIRENAGMLQVTAATDPLEYSISYGEGTASVSWTVGDEQYELDIDFRICEATAVTCHERAPGVPMRTWTEKFYFVIGNQVDLAVQLKACADAHLEKGSEYERVGKNLTGSMNLRKVGNLLYSLLRGNGWATIYP